MSGPTVGAVVLFSYGHEGGGREQSWLGTGDRSASPGRELGERVEDALCSGEGPVCVVPMTLGRDPGLIADSARTLQWAANSARTGRLVLAEPFGTADHLVGWLRAAAIRVPGPDADRRAVLVTAAAANPFDDADLFRIARLVRQYGRHRWVEVAFEGGDPDIEEGVDRCLRLGAGRVRLIPAGFGPAGPDGVFAGAHAEDGGPLLASSAIRGVVSARVAAALERLARGDNGIRTGLDAEHGHAYAHTHTHSHTNMHDHTHVHSHH